MAIIVVEASAAKSHRSSRVQICPALLGAQELVSPTLYRPGSFEQVSRCPQDRGPATVVGWTTFARGSIGNERSELTCQAAVVPRNPVRWLGMSHAPDHRRPIADVENPKFASGPLLLICLIPINTPAMRMFGPVVESCRRDIPRTA